MTAKNIVLPSKAILRPGETGDYQSGTFSIFNGTNEKVAYKIRSSKHLQDNIKSRPFVGVLESGQQATVELQVKGVPSGMLQVLTTPMPSVFKDNVLKFTSMKDIWAFVMPKDIKVQAVEFETEYDQPSGDLENDEMTPVTDQAQNRLLEPNVDQSSGQGSEPRTALPPRQMDLESYIDKVKSSTAPYNTEKEELFEQAVAKITYLENKNHDLRMTNKALMRDLKMLSIQVTRAYNLRSSNQLDGYQKRSCLLYAFGPILFALVIGLFVKILGGF